MFTGIVSGLFKVASVHRKLGLVHYSIELTPEILQGLEKGASISVDGVCQTVVKIEDRKVWLDAIEETLNRSTLGDIQAGKEVNIERAAKFGDEIGGHLLSGHVYGKAQILHLELSENNRIFTLQCRAEWIKYFFSKGFIALDGVSLTLVDVAPAGTFTVHLIPETLRMTTFGQRKKGDWVNVELDSQTQVIVETVERVLHKKN